MRYRELVNFSIYEYDLKKFDDDWDNVRLFLKNLQLDGLELLVNFEEVPDKIPGDLVTSVHLPSFMGWYRIWEDGKFEIPKDIPAESVKYFYGGYDREEIVSNFCKSMSNAAVLDPVYGVYHAAYTEIGNAFQEVQPYTNREILQANAEFLNEVASRFPGGEPPFDIYIENLWYPGLTFMEPEETYEFIDSLGFGNWRLLLDTGHLMNATGLCNDENGAIDIVLGYLEQLDRSVIDRISGIHLHLSTSGDYIKDLTEPENYGEMKLEEKYTCVYELLKNVDQHRPFSSERCREIVDFISPEYVTHELQGATSEEIEAGLKMQTAALRGTGNR